MLRLTKTVLIFAVAAYGFVAVFHNVADWSGTLDAVRSATSMSTFEGGADSWQATSNPLVVWLGALFIASGKLAAGVLCAVGGARMWRASSADADAFQRSKSLALAGCGVVLFMLFVGFVVVAESWFELWRSDALRGPVLNSALRYAAMIGLIAIFVGMRDD